ncbi:hypothetical protein [Azospirillum doebereinerae]
MIGIITHNAQSRGSLSCSDPEELKSVAVIKPSIDSKRFAGRITVDLA